MSHIPDRTKCFADTNDVPTSYGVAHRSPMGDAHIGARAKHAGLFQIRIKAGDCTNCRAIRYEKMFPRYKWAAIQLRQLHAVAHPSAEGVPQIARPIWPPLYRPAATARESALQNKRAASARRRKYPHAHIDSYGVLADLYERISQPNDTSLGRDVQSERRNLGDPPSAPEVEAALETRPVHRYCPDTVHAVVAVDIKEVGQIHGVPCCLLGMAGKAYGPDLELAPACFVQRIRGQVPLRLSSLDSPPSENQAKNSCVWKTRNLVFLGAAA